MLERTEAERGAFFDKHGRYPDFDYPRDTPSRVRPVDKEYILQIKREGDSLYLNKLSGLRHHFHVYWPSLLRWVGFNAQDISRFLPVEYVEKSFYVFQGFEFNQQDDMAFLELAYPGMCYWYEPEFWEMQGTLTQTKYANSVRINLPEFLSMFSPTKIKLLLNHLDHPAWGVPSSGIYYSCC